MADIADRFFALALAHQSAGDLPAAILAYRQISTLVPAAFPLLINYATAVLQTPSAVEALPLIQRAQRLLPDHPLGHRLLGDALRARGDAVASRRAYRHAILLAPDLADPYNNLGTLLQSGADPGCAVLFQRAVRLAPDQAEPLANLSAQWLRQERPREAATAARHALCLAPQSAANWNNLGNAWLAADAIEAAERIFSRALALQPDLLEACLNLGGLRNDHGTAAAGDALSRRAMLLAPGAADGYNNAGNAALLQGDLAMARQRFDRARRLAPDDAQIRYNAAAVLLKQGDFAAGWPLYEARRHTPTVVRHGERFAKPAWRGEPLAGRTLLLWAEQGYGDVLQFCRYAPLLAAQNDGRILLRVYPPLQRLLQSLPGVAAVLAEGEPLPDHDCHASLMSLPYLCNTRLSTIPATIPYLAADPLAATLWRHRLSAFSGRRVGLVWSGDPRPQQRGAHWLDQRRSVTLSQMAPLLALPGVAFISLQKGAAQAQCATVDRIVDCGADLRDFADTAAVIDGLDLVISVDTAVAHLAGALGKPVWILSRFDGCWRWLDQRDDSPWYPSARLFRQTAPGDWQAPMARLTQALAEFTQ